MPPKKKKVAPKGKDKVERGPAGLAVLDQLAEENEVAGDDGRLVILT